MYNQSIIDSIGENYFEAILNKKIPYTLSIDNLNSVEQQKYYAFQHYLVKVALSGKYRSECIQYLSSMYTDFRNKPYLFCDSPIIRNDFLNSFVNDVNYRNKIINYRNKYYNVDIAKQLYNKQLNSNLNNDEKNQLYAYLIHKLKKIKSSTELLNDKILTNAAKQIVNSNISTLNDMQLKFYCQYVSRFALDNYNHELIIMIGIDKDNYGYQSEDYICISKPKINSIAEVTQTVCHETRHSIQRYDSKNNQNFTAFDYAQRILFRNYLDTDTYNSYKQDKNYRYSRIELDAEDYGFRYTSRLFKFMGRNDLATINEENKRKELNHRNDYNYMTDSDNKKNQTDKFIVENMDAIILNHPDELNNYPVLKMFYYDDGRKKTFDVILNQRTEEFNNRRSYIDYINIFINKGELENISLNKNTFNTLCYIFDLEYAYALENYFNDEHPMQFSNGQAYRHIRHYLSLSFKLLSCIAQNYEKCLKEFDSFDNFDASISRLLSRIKIFNIENIKNPAVTLYPDLIKKIERIRELFNYILIKRNLGYELEKLNKVSPEVLKSSMTFPDGKFMKFEDYFKNVIFPNMDEDRHVIVNGEKKSVTILIHEYEKLALQRRNKQNMTTDSDINQSKSR